jgi:two-component system sensor histidine kinase VicK
MEGNWHAALGCMSRAIKILIVEDSENDTILLVHQLKTAGYAPHYKRVDNAEAMRSALEMESWEAILSDYVMPQFSAAEALAIYQQSKLEIPFIVVSGRIGEEVAVEMMKAGAHDYIRKDHLSRLIPALNRELQSTRERLVRKRAEAATVHLASIVESCEDAIISQTLDGTVLSWNSGAEQIFGYQPDAIVGRPISILVPPGEPDELGNVSKLMQSKKPLDRFERIRIRKDGKPISVSMTVSPIRNLAGAVAGYSLVMRDISQRKQQDAERLRLIHELSNALARVKTLTGLLPICASCKKIRNAHNHWEQIESYVEHRSSAEFTHSFCPDCLERLYPDVAKKISQNPNLHLANLNRVDPHPPPGDRIR